MKNKEQFLKKLSDILDTVEDNEAEVSYLSMELTNYNPDNRKNERKLCYFQVEVDYIVESGHFTLNDRSEPFICTMDYKDCKERGYCNGDC